MNNEAALAQYQRQVDSDCYESDFIERYWIEQTEELEADIKALLVSKGYDKRVIAFFEDVGAHSGLDEIFTEMAQEAYASRLEREP